MGSEDDKKGEGASSLRSDEPIRTQDQDRLARAHLVEVIGRHILHADAPESVVIALNAPWGAGKSSFLNLLEQKLVRPAGERHATALPDSRPIVVRFNPWHYSSVEQLVAMFFAELARGIGTSSRKELANKIGEGLRAVGSIAGIFHSGAGEFIKEAGGALKEGKSLAELKRELDKLLPDLAQRVVVFIDDVDRLERDTLRLLFRMVRLNADFANVTYVLAFDRLVVEKNLDEPNGIRGRDYLEKIIQVSFDIPEPEPSTRRRILFAEMDAVLGSLKTRPLDQHRWGNVFHSGFQEHFRTIRHIKRYSNGLRLTLTPVAEEVDLVDFLAVELLRVFHPEVYQGVSAGKDMLAPTRTGYGDSIPVDRLRQWVEELSAKASPGFAEHVLSLLRELFPELARVYANTHYGEGHHAQWRRDCRVCSPSVFDKFFLLAVPEGEIAEVEMRSFVDGVADRARTKAFLGQARESGRARRLMERLEDFTDELPPHAIAPLVRTLFDEGDSLRFEPRGFLDITADMQVPRIIYRCLKKLSTDQERHDLLMPCVNEGSSLYTVVQEVSLSEPTEKVSQGPPTFTSRDLWERLRDAAVERIEKACTDGTVWDVRSLPEVLYSWARWRDEATVRAAVSKHVQSDEALVRFIGTFVSHSHSHQMGDKVARKHVRLSKKNLAAFLDLDATLARLRLLFHGKGDLAEVAGGLVTLLERPPERPWDE
jgi:predicted KAP-like P-loop ATPase